MNTNVCMNDNKDEIPTVYKQKNMPDTIVFPDFEDISVSTQTFTICTNLQINMQELFDKIPITPYTVVPKKRGRKKKMDTVNSIEELPYGSVVTAKYITKVKGVELKPKKTKVGKKNKWFRNSITIVIMFDKFINFKICNNGTFQMTGCKSTEHAEDCVKFIWDLIKEDNTLYSFTRGDTVEMHIIPSMRNIDFSLGFLIDREKLNKYIISIPECILEDSIDYTGVNVKFPLKQSILDMKIKQITYDKTNDSWVDSTMLYKDITDILPKDRNNRLKVEKYNTFLIFHSGKIIMSGLTKDFMKDVYYEFLDIIKNGYNDIKEKLDM